MQRAAILFVPLFLLLHAPIMAAEKSFAQPGMAQVPTWSRDDLNFFLHGSMGTEIFPEPVLRTFIKVYPELFPTSNLAHLGLIPDPDFGWPIGFSRKTAVKHLGNLPAVGINCASCHVSQITSTASDKPIRLLGTTSDFNVEALFGAVLGATFKTTDPANMKKFLALYLGARPAAFEAAWERQQDKIVATMKEDPSGAKDIAPGELNEIATADLQPPIDSDTDLASRAHAMLRLFHNIRAVLHVPDQPPEKLPPASGPGRNDAFGLLSASLLNSPQPYAPIKFGLVWNVEKRPWVHWDGNTRSPIARNLLASLGLGAPLHGNKADLDFQVVRRQTELTEKIRPPRYLFAISESKAKQGAKLFATNCASCHAGPENDQRLHAVAEVGTDPLRASLFNQRQADGFNKFLAELELTGYQPPKEPGVRSTGKYFAASLGGVWARSPYLHNGSVRTMQELLRPPNERSKSFHRGSQRYDVAQMGFTDDGAFLLDTTMEGNSNSGHDYGTHLSAKEKAQLMEYLKTL
ncbi:MAG TPA: hypothetical protein VGI60_16410 [Chthoniobacterales bacterium]|jgi:cytochrome c553